MFQLEMTSLQEFDPQNDMPSFKSEEVLLKKECLRVENDL